MKLPFYDNLAKDGVVSSTHYSMLGLFGGCKKD